MTFEWLIKNSVFMFQLLLFFFTNNSTFYFSQNKKKNLKTFQITQNCHKKRILATARTTNTSLFPSRCVNVRKWKWFGQRECAWGDGYSDDASNDGLHMAEGWCDDSKKVSLIIWIFQIVNFLNFCLNLFFFFYVGLSYHWVSLEAQKCSTFVFHFCSKVLSMAWTFFRWELQLRLQRLWSLQCW